MVCFVLTGRAYRFRVVAIYANSESRHSPMSIKLVTDASLATPPRNVPPPVIVEVRPLNINEIFIGWQVRTVFKVVSLLPIEIRIPI